MDPVLKGNVLDRIVRRIPVAALAEAGGLVVALGFVALMAFIPHLDTFRAPPPEELPEAARLASAGAGFVRGTRADYPFPLHVDEYAHWVQVSAMQRDESVVPDDPFSGAPAAPGGLLSLRGTVHERGFHLVLAEVQWLTGISFFSLFRFLPALWLAFGAFGVYACLRPSPLAVPAAALVGLVPTTLRFLGPGFLVPIGFVLPWIVAVALLVQPARQRLGAALLLLVTLTWAFFIHLIGGFAAAALLVFMAPFGKRDERRAGAIILLLAALPLAALFQTFGADVEKEVKTEEFLPIDFTIFDDYGLPALFLWAAGTVLVLTRPPTVARVPTVTFTLASLLFLALIIGSVALDLDRYATYARWHPPFFFTAAVPASYALVLLGQGIAAGTRRLLPRLSLRHVPRLLGVLAASALMVASTAQGIEFHIKQPFYHVVDEREWSIFQSIEGRLGPDYDVFLAHPWKSPVLTAMTGKHPYSFLIPGGAPIHGTEYDLVLATGGTLEFFILNDITFVIDPQVPPPAPFEPIGDGVWALPPEVAQEIASIRAIERAR